MTNNIKSSNKMDSNNEMFESIMKNVPIMSRSICGRYFAITSLIGQLNVWDTITSDLIAQYIPTKHLLTKCTRISWPNQYNNVNNHLTNGTLNPKNDNYDAKIHDLNKLNLIALGTENGTIFIFSVHKNEIYKIFESNNTKNLKQNHQNNDHHTERINDICWSKKSIDTLFSCSQDKFIIEWSLSECQIICKTILDHNSIITSICCIDDEYLMTGSNQLKLWNWPKRQLLRIFNGHSNEINFLRSLRISPNEHFVLSTAISDRYIYLWKLTDLKNQNHSSNKPSNSSATFLLDNEPISLELCKSNDSLFVLSVSKTGNFHLFDETIEQLLTSNNNQINSNKHQPNGPIKSKYCLNIQIDSCNDDNNNFKTKSKRQIPYIYAYIDPDQMKMQMNGGDDLNLHSNKKLRKQLNDKNRIYIQTIYGTVSRPIFERINLFDCEKLCNEQNNRQYITIKKDSSILDQINLLSKPILDNFSISNHTSNYTKIKSTKINDSKTTIIGPAGMVAQQPLFDGCIYDSEQQQQSINGDDDQHANKSKDSKCDTIETNVNNNDSNQKQNESSQEQLTFDEQLKQMKIDNSTTENKSKNQSKSQQEQIGIESLVSILIQGLQSKDAKMLSTVLQQNHDDSIIINTIKKLPIQYLSKLLNELQKGLLYHQHHDTSSDSQTSSTSISHNEQYSIYLKWIKFLLHNRFSYLMTMPKSANKFLPLKQMIQAKTATLDKCYQLKGRLDLILSQAKLDDKQDTERLSFEKPKLTYESESSEDYDEDDDEDINTDDQMSIDDNDLMEDDDDDEEEDPDDDIKLCDRQTSSNDDDDDESDNDDSESSENEAEDEASSNEIEDSDEEMNQSKTMNTLKTSKSSNKFSNTSKTKLKSKKRKFSENTEDEDD